MVSWPSFLSLVHLAGLFLGVGAATAKTVLLLKCRRDIAFVPHFIAVSRPLTKQIITGLVLLTLSGAGFLVAGYPFTPLLIVKLVMVGAIFVLGPIIDNVVEPAFRRDAPAPGSEPSPAFLASLNRYVTVEVLATGLFYVIVISWVLA